MRSKRFEVLLPGVIVLGLTGLLLARLSPSFFPHPDWTITFRLFTDVVFAPLVLLRYAALGEHIIPAWLVTIATIAIATLPFDPLLRREWTGSVTATGLMAWFGCQLVVALLVI